MANRQLRKLQQTMRVGAVVKDPRNPGYGPAVIYGMSPAGVALVWFESDADLIGFCPIDAAFNLQVQDTPTPTAFAPWMKKMGMTIPKEV